MMQLFIKDNHLVVAGEKSIYTNMQYHLERRGFKFIGYGGGSFEQYYSTKGTTTTIIENDVVAREFLKKMPLTLEVKVKELEKQLDKIIKQGVSNE